MQKVTVSQDQVSGGSTVTLWDGSVVVMWVASNLNVMAAVYTSKGEILTNPFIVGVQYSSDVAPPTIAAFMDNSFVVASYANSNTMSVQRFDKYSNSLGNNQVAISFMPPTTGPKLATFEDGTFVVTWAEMDTSPEMGEYLKVQSFDNAGQVLGQAVVTSLTSIANCPFAKIDILSLNNVFFLLRSYAPTPSCSGYYPIIGHFFNKDCTSVRPSFTLTSSNNFITTFTKARFNNGSFVLVWEESSSPVSTPVGIYAKSFYENGTAIYQQTVLTPTNGVDTFNLAVQTFFDYSFVVAWTMINTTYQSIEMQWFTKQWKLGANNHVQTGTMFPSLFGVDSVTNSSGVVVWSDNIVPSTGLFLQDTANRQCNNISFVESNSYPIDNVSTAKLSYFPDNSYVALFTRNDQGTVVLDVQGFFSNNTPTNFTRDVVSYPYITHQDIVTFDDKSFAIFWSSFTTSTSLCTIEARYFNTHYQATNKLSIPVSRRFNGDFKTASLGNAFVITFMKNKGMLVIQKYNNNSSLPLYTVNETTCSFPLTDVQVQTTDTCDSFVVAMSHSNNNTTVARYNSTNGIVLSRNTLSYNVTNFTIGVNQDVTAFVWQDGNSCSNNLPAYMQILGIKTSNPVQISASKDPAIPQVVSVLKSSYVVGLSLDNAIVLRWFYNNHLVSDIYTKVEYNKLPQEIKINELSAIGDTANISVSYITDYGLSQSDYELESCNISLAQHKSTKPNSEGISTHEGSDLMMQVITPAIIGVGLIATCLINQKCRTTVASWTHKFHSLSSSQEFYNNEFLEDHMLSGQQTPRYGTIEGSTYDQSELSNV